MWQPIETAPADSRRMFVVRALDVCNEFTGNFPYTTNSYYVWRDSEGAFVRWPHKFPPTHWMPAPKAQDTQAQSVPSVLDGWLRAIDEALVVAHLGVANADDSYEEAERKLNELICWHTDVATDPAVNGGFKLVPIEPDEMWAYRVIRHHQPNLEVGCGDWMKCLETMLHWHAAMLAAAPEAKS